MFTVIGQFFRAVGMFFVAFENVGKMAVVATEVGLEATNGMADQAKINRAKDQIRMNAELAVVKNTAMATAKSDAKAELKAA